MKTSSIIYLSIILLIGCNHSIRKTEIPRKEQLSQSNEATPVFLSDTIFTFENDKAGKIPSSWSQYFTGRGDTTDWKILELPDKQASANNKKVLAQLSEDNPNHHFNVIVFDGFKVKNVSLKVKMKGVRGRKDQGGGFVWRFLDADNYYVVRANPLEDNVVLYKVENGKRTDLPVLGKGRTYGVDVNPLGKKWNTLELTVVNNLFSVSLNNKQIFKVADTTFTNAGKIGLWTKADAVTYFDDLQVVNIK